MTKAQYEDTYRAAFDQRLKAIQAVKRAWPYNAHLCEDDNLHQAMESIIQQPDAGRLVGMLNGHPLLPNGPESSDLQKHCALLGTAWLLWDAAAAPLDVPLTTADIEAKAQDTAPAAQFARCDRCGDEERSAVVLLPFPPYIIALQLCRACSADLAVNAAPVRFSLPTESKE